MTTYGVSDENGKRTQRRLSPMWLSQTTLFCARGLFRKRGRAILTVLALTCASTAFLTIQMTTYSVNTHLSQLFGQYDYDVVVNVDPQPYDQVRAPIANISNVARIEQLEQMNAKSPWGNMLLTGIEPDSQIYHTQLIGGRILQPGEENALLISEVAAQKTGLKVGDTITLSTATHDQTWHIVGEIHDLYGRLRSGKLQSIGDTPYHDLGGSQRWLSSCIPIPQQHSPSSITPCLVK